MKKDLIEWASIEDGVDSLLDAVLEVLNGSKFFQSFGPVTKENVYTDVLFKAAASRVLGAMIEGMEDPLNHLRHVLKPELVEMIEAAIEETKNRLEVKL